VAVTGRWTPSPGAEQSFELHADSVRVLGTNDATVSISGAVHREHLPANDASSTRSRRHLYRRNIKHPNFFARCLICVRGCPSTHCFLG
jgi:aspartyl/asparaginyl-tRNA synthetase